MSIASEITRLQGAKSDLAASITAKGVTVPSSTKLDGYAALVDQISGGGGIGTLIQTVPVSGVRAIQIDCSSSWESYDAIIVTTSITLTASDWVYIAFDATTSSRYCNQRTTFSFAPFAIISKRQQDDKWYIRELILNGYASSALSTLSGHYIYCYCYSSSTKMNGSYSIYGINF